VSLLEAARGGAMERLGGAGVRCANALEDLTRKETRYVVLGHLQRGGTPTAFDRVLATRFGFAAAQLVHRGEFGRMVALQGDACTSVPLDQVAGRNRVVPADHALVQTALATGVWMG
jgi:ATP-dependent phosphofructokinase / diphosphate-dependent phosphofructokinase